MPAITRPEVKEAMNVPMDCPCVLLATPVWLFRDAKLLTVRSNVAILASIFHYHSTKASSAVRTYVKCP